MTDLSFSAVTPCVVTRATLRRRLACLLYESLLLLGILAFGFIAPLLALGVIFNATPHGSILWLHLFALFGGYFVWLWRRNGQTLAMQTWQLQIVAVDTGKPPCLKRCLMRYALAWPSMLFLLSGAGLLWVFFFDQDQQFPHDRLAGTVIVFNPARAQEVS